MARQNFATDYDFIGFTYNGYHSIDDLGIYRVSEGNMYETNLTPTIQEISTSADDVSSLVAINHTEKIFNLNFAFENLTEEKIRTIQTIFDTDAPKELVFDETPYKAYLAKLNAPVSIAYICFDSSDGTRIYKGEGTISFICYNPYARTPRGEIETTFYSPKIEVTEENESESYIEFNITDKNTLELLGKPGGIITLDTDGTFDYWVFGDKIAGGYVEGSLTTDSLVGLDYNSLKYGIGNPDGMTYTRLKITNAYTDRKNALAYCFFTNADQFLPASGLSNDPQDGENPGDIPAPFILSKDEVEKDTEFKVGELSIKLLVDTYNLKWDSKTGIVSGTATSDPKSKRSAIPIEGNALGGIPVGGLTASEMTLHEATLEYDYWYY